MIQLNESRGREKHFFAGRHAMVNRSGCTESKFNSKIAFCTRKTLVDIFLLMSLWTVGRTVIGKISYFALGAVSIEFYGVSFWD